MKKPSLDHDNSNQTAAKVNTVKESLVSTLSTYMSK